MAEEFAVPADGFDGDKAGEKEVEEEDKARDECGRGRESCFCAEEVAGEFAAGECSCEEEEGVSGDEEEEELICVWKGKEVEVSFEKLNF